MFTPFYTPGSQDKLSSKVKKSNVRHLILERKADSRFDKENDRYKYANDIFSNVNYNPDIHLDNAFYARVSREYHSSVYNFQTNNNRIASKKEKKDIYNANLCFCIEHRKIHLDHVPKNLKNKKYNLAQLEKWL